MKPLTLEEARLKEEMKNNCLKVGKYKDEKAKDKFKMLCHLEDFEIQYWELQQENKILKENAENNDKVVDKVNWENMLLKKENEQLKDNWNDLKKYTKEVISTDNELYGTDLLDKMQELEKENSNEEGTNNCKNTKLFSYWR